MRENENAPVALSVFGGRGSRDRRIFIFTPRPLQGSCGLHPSVRTFKENA